MYITSFKTKPVLVAALFSLFLAGCSAGQENTNSENVATHSVTHELGTAEVPDKAERVVTLELGLTETAAALGVIPIGVADDDKPERIAEDTMKLIDGYTSVGTRAQPNLEVIRSLNPDLIIADVDRHESIYEELQKIAPTVAYKDDAANYETVVETTTKLGEALNKESEAEKLITQHNQLSEELKSKMEVTDKTVLQAGYSEGNVFSVSTSSAFTPGFLTTLGVNYALQDDTATTQELTIEQLLKINPDTLIVTITEDAPSVLEILKEDPLWNKLTAVSSKQVYEVGHNDWSRRRTLLAIEDNKEKLTEILQNMKTENAE